MLFPSCLSVAGCGGRCGSLYSAYCGLSADADAVLSVEADHTVAVMIIIMVAGGAKSVSRIRTH